MTLTILAPLCVIVLLGGTFIAIVNRRWRVRALLAMVPAALVMGYLVLAARAIAAEVDLCLYQTEDGASVNDASPECLAARERAERLWAPLEWLP